MSSTFPLHEPPSDAKGPFHLDPRCSVRVAVVGAERRAVIVVDHLLEEAPQLVEFAANHATFRPVMGPLYPGIRAPMPHRYLLDVLSLLSREFCTTFARAGIELLMGQADFSLVTLRPDQCQAARLLPHIDATEPNMFAAIHFLCPAGHGGTSFYRHRGTGFESIDRAREPPYLRARGEELAAAKQPVREFINGDSATYERIASFDALFNRMLIYCGVMLHAGNITPDFAFDADPRRGRLTANSFFLLR